MNATTATTARPTNAAIAWATKDAIFVEIPCRDSHPLIVRYRRTTDGLAQALNILLERSETETRQITREHPKITKAKPGCAWATEDQRQRATEVLKRLKIT